LAKEEEGTAMSDTPRPDNDGRSRGEGPERNPDGTYNKSQVGQREQADKEAGNPKEKQAEQERISRNPSSGLRVKKVRQARTPLILSSVLRKNVEGRRP